MNEVRDDLRLAPLAVLIADDYLEKGVVETTPNWSPDIKEFLEDAGIHHPAPWCAAFVWHCILEACSRQDVANPMADIQLPAWVPSYRRWGERNSALVSAGGAGIGDLFLLYYPSKERYGHIGFVRRPPFTNRAGTLVFDTIEGNTNESGSREGIKVMEKQRVVGDKTLFLNWSDAE